MSDTLEILKAARALISEPEHWTQGAYGRTSQEDEDGVYDLEEATCFCAVGAIHKAGNFDVSCTLPSYIGVPFLGDEGLLHYDSVYFEGKLVDFNDTHSQEDVLSLFDRAIARAEGEVL
jgi:hypothetical protein